MNFRFLINNKLVEIPVDDPEIMFMLNIDDKYVLEYLVFLVKHGHLVNYGITREDLKYFNVRRVLKDENLNVKCTGEAEAAKIIEFDTDGSAEEQAEKNKDHTTSKKVTMRQSKPDKESNKMNKTIGLELEGTAMNTSLFDDKASISAGIEQQGFHSTTKNTSLFEDKKLPVIKTGRHDLLPNVNKVDATSESKNDIAPHYNRDSLEISVLPSLTSLRPHDPLSSSADTRHKVEIVEPTEWTKMHLETVTFCKNQLAWLVQDLENDYKLRKRITKSLEKLVEHVTKKPRPPTDS